MKLLREPLFQFVALGALLFLVHAVVSELASSDASRRIEIAQPQIELLATTWARQWQRPPTEGELRSLVEARAREEVLYREALAVGLDRDDSMVRRRMVQKMELLTQDLALLADPTDQELQDFFRERQEEYRVPPRVSFTHVYFNLDRRGDAAKEDARQALVDIRAMSPPPRNAPEFGDRFLLPYEYDLVTPLEVQRQFGARFAETLLELEPGWHGPILSGYGLHLVHVTDRVESRAPSFDEIRDRLVADYNRMRGDRAKDALYEGLSTKYEVEIDEDAVRRVALSGATE